MIRFLAVVTLVMGTTLSASAEVRHYMAVFAFQGRLNLPKDSHTWATFTAVDNERGTAESFTVSWMPRTLQVLLNGPAETGVNLDVRQSIELGISQRFRVTEFGPYRIQAELFERARKQKERLDRNEILYQCLDGNVRPSRGSNCIHAVADIDMDHGLLQTGIARGKRASAMVVRHLSRWILDKGKTHPEIDDHLGITHYPLDHHG